MTQNAEPTDTVHKFRDAKTADTICIEVIITYAGSYCDATFIDDRKAAEWATDTLMKVVQRHGISRWDIATVVFTRR